MKSKILRYTGKVLFSAALLLSCGSTEAFANEKPKPQTVAVPEGDALPMLVMTGGMLGAALVLARRVVRRQLSR
jgi:hypothetical protein